ncbi:hypothetical protein LIER_19345 [Lithospermum erythrorhizon]|uniref:Uncharacterized protein n=1 Tax=Lithospermum erythrorhizon TaxID=34254 RepID=A0AAV3QN07_LITER
MNVKVLDEGLETCEDDGEVGTPVINNNTDNATKTTTDDPGDNNRGKKNVEDGDDDACKVVEPHIVEEKTQKLKGHKKSRKGKGEGSKALVSTKRRGDDTRVLNPTPLRSIPAPVDTTYEVTNVAQSQIHNNYLPWIDYTNVRNLDNPRTEVDDRDADVGGDESKSEIPTEENVADETITAIVEEGIEDYSCSEGAANLSEHSAVPSDTDFMGDVTPSIADNGAGAVGLSEERAEPTAGDGVADTLNTKDVEFPKSVSQKKKKSKKRKHKKGVDEGEAFESKKKLSKEEHGLDEEDITAIIIKRRKAKGKLKIDENRYKVENKRIPKNVATVSTENVALNSEEKEAKWRFVACRRIAAERMLSEVTKKNADIMGILEDAGVMPTVETVGPYFPKLSRLAQKYVLEAHLRSLTGKDDLAVDPDASDSKAESF